MHIKVPEAFSCSQSVSASPDPVISLRPINRWNWFGCLETWKSGSSWKLSLCVLLPLWPKSCNSSWPQFLCWALQFSARVGSLHELQLPQLIRMLCQTLAAPFPWEVQYDFLLPSQLLAGPAVTERITWNHAWFWVLSSGLLPELRYPNSLAQSGLVMPFDHCPLACLAASWGWASSERRLCTLWIFASSLFHNLFWCGPSLSCTQMPPIKEEEASRDGGKQTSDPSLSQHLWLQDFLGPLQCGPWNSKHCPWSPLCKRNSKSRRRLLRTNMLVVLHILYFWPLFEGRKKYFLLLDLFYKNKPIHIEAQ